MLALHQDGSKLPGLVPSAIGRYPCNLYNLVMEVITVFLYLRLFLQSTKRGNIKIAINFQSWEEFSKQKLLILIKGKRRLALQSLVINFRD